MGDELKTAWTTKSKREEKPWGYEIIWSSLIGAHGKRIFIRKGFRSSLKCHTRKNEVLYVLSGKLLVHFGNEEIERYNLYDKLEEKILEVGDCLNIQSGCPYRITALEDSEVIEIGDTLNGTIKRIEDDYGRC